MSKLFKLDNKDLLRGLVVAVLTAVLTLVLKMLENKGLTFDSVDLQTILTTAVIAAVSYLTKNLLTDDKGKLVGKVRVK